jgi:hypothetical protein
MVVLIASDHVAIIVVPVLVGSVLGLRRRTPSAISSAGLHALLRERPHRIRVVCPAVNVVRLFEIVRANRRVQTAPTSPD